MLNLLRDPELTPTLDPGLIVIEITEQSSADYPWTGLNPFFMYGVGSPYLPDWW